MKRIRYAVLCALMFASMQQVSAQDDLNIFGYFQTTFMQGMPVDSLSKPSNTFNTQQLNVFLSKNFGEDFSSFINLELTNTFSSERNWGGLNLEEAWMKYSPSDVFNVKAGLLIPRFNNLNEIKNRTPILPYIIRPLVYESSITDLINIEGFVPQRAFLQVYGNLSVADNAKFDYAVYVGNSGKEYIAAKLGSSVVRGTDSTTYKMIGGRAGFTYNDLKLGVSGVYDRENLNGAPYQLGDVPRVRIGADLSYSIIGFTLEGEFIMVNVTLTDEKKQKLEALSKVNPQVGTSADRMFYYAYLTYNFSPQFYAFGGYSRLEQKLSRFWENGFQQITGGLGYRPIDQITLKAQFAHYEAPNNKIREYAMNYLYLGASVFF